MTYKNILRKGILAVSVIGMVLSFFSCTNDPVSAVMDEKKLITDIQLDVTPTLPLLIGTDTIVEYKIYPDDASFKDVIWKSSNSDIALVDAEGRITALHTGKTIISAMPAVGFSVTSTFELSVVDKIYLIEDIQITTPNLELFATASLQLEWETTPFNATYQRLIWESLTPEIVQIDKAGNIKGIKEGTAIIKVTATDDGKFSKEFQVTVKPIIYIESIEFVKSNDQLALNEIYIPEILVYPINATVSALRWESSNPNVVEVDADGRFTAKNYGTSLVTAIADYGDGEPIKTSMQIKVVEGKLNDTFEFGSPWINHNNQCKIIEWLEDKRILSIFPGDDKNYKAFRIKRTDGFSFNVSTYPILAFKVKFPEGVWKASTKIEWYLDMWGGISSGGKYGADTNKGNQAMSVLEVDDSQVFYADFTKKPVGTEMVPTSLQKVDNIVLEIWKIWYEADEEGRVELDWIKTFESEQSLKDFLN